MPIVDLNSVYYDCSVYWNDVFSKKNSLVYNLDGTISVFMPNNTGTFVPNFISKSCCDVLRDYTNNDEIYFDIDTQKCKWSKNLSNNSPIRLNINPQTNDGATFYVTSAQTCSLTIEFDYLFKFDCQTLSNIIINSNSITDGCKTPTSVFETLDVSLVLETIGTSPTGLVTGTTIYEENIFPQIGEGNLYTYMTNHPENSGLYVCGDPLASETWTSGCTPLIYPEFTYLDSQTLFNDPPNVIKCTSIKSNLYNSLFTESNLTNDSAGNNSFKQSLSYKIFASNWLNYSLTIDDANLISQMTNKKIRFYLKLNNYCSNVCALMDNIVMKEDCKEVKENRITIPKSPGFNLERIIDNKKSWVKTSDRVNRNFEILNVFDNNPIRVTNYNLDDSRLVINTKEIDLAINPSYSIEYDVWKFITDNTCLLTGTTITSCTYTVTACTGSVRGDNKINFNRLLSTDITTVESADEFIEVISSELIDAKNRKTIQSYPTLKALYERYMAPMISGSTTGFCGTLSSRFGYMSIESFANLIGNYWVDIVEQLVPSTTIWGANKIYTNTVFDEQKFRYKMYSSLFWTNSATVTNQPFYGYKVSSPINMTSGKTQNVNVISKTITDQNPTIINNTRYSIAQLNRGSEFIGKVTITNN